MKDRDWVLIAYCRSCGVDGVVEIADDHTMVWPVLIHEWDCERAEPQDLKELHHHVMA